MPICLMISSYSHISIITIEIKLKEVFHKKADQKLQQKTFLLQWKMRNFNLTFYPEIQPVHHHQNYDILKLDCTLCFYRTFNRNTPKYSWSHHEHEYQINIFMLSVTLSKMMPMLDVFRQKY